METFNYVDDISSFDKLSILEAQELYKKALNTQNENMKKEYMDKLIMGTLYVIYNHVNNRDLDTFSSAMCDKDDIMSSFISVWIKRLYSGALLNINNYTLIFTSSFYTDVYELLYGDKIDILGNFSITSEFIEYLLYAYISYRNNYLLSGNQNLNDYIIEYFSKDYYLRRIDKETITDSLFKLLPIFENIYSILSNHDTKPVNFSKTRIQLIIQYFIHTGIVEPITQNMPYNKSTEEEAIDNLVFEEIKENLARALEDERAFKMIEARFGLDGNGPRTFDEIAKDHNVSYKRVMQICDHRLRKIRDNEYFRSYKDQL